MRRTAACLAVLLPCLHLAPASAEVRVLLADTIRTGDPQQPLATALAWDTDSGRLLAVGTRDAVLQRYPRAARTDAGKVAVTPGLIDAHAHLAYLGNTLAQADLSGARSRAEVVARLRAFEKTLAPGEWLLGAGWDQNRWEEGAGFPTLADLDAAFPDRPVYLDRIDGHAGWVNSAALRIAGEAGRPLSGDWQPEGGRIVRDAAGNATGVLVDNAAALVSAHIPAPDDATREKRLEAALREAVRNGLTGVHDMGVSRDELALMKRLADQGRLPLRIDAYADGNHEALADLCAQGLYRHPGGRLQMRGVKLFMDGALGSRGAAMLADYSDDPHNRGLLVTSPEDFEAAVRKADGCKVQVATHAIGDRGNRIVLDTYEKVLGAHKGDHRWRVEHAQVVALEDIPRFAGLGVIASMQPTHATSDMGWAEQRVGLERIKGAYAWQRYLHSGAHLALGSDFPVEQVDPRLGLYAAVTRQDRDGQPPGGWQPEQRLSAAEALRGFTSDAAWAGHDEADVGRLQPGLHADFVVFDRDPLDAGGVRLDALKVLSTWVDGVPVYEAAPSAR